MDSSDDENADIDKDDDVADEDYNPGKDVNDSHSEDEYDEEDVGLSDEESLDGIKNKLKEKFAKNSSTKCSNSFTPSPKTPGDFNKFKKISFGKENSSPSFSWLHRA